MLFGHGIHIESSDDRVVVDDMEMVLFLPLSFGSCFNVVNFFCKNKSWSILSKAKLVR